jgi:hypothetical protein
MPRSMRPRVRDALSGTMSANAIIRRIPAAEELFAGLHIDRRHEGDDPVDELAWRHGLNPAVILEALERLAGPARAAQTPRRRSGAASWSS